MVKTSVNAGRTPAFRQKPGTEEVRPTLWADPGPRVLPVLRERLEQWGRTDIGVELAVQSLAAGLWGVRIDAPDQTAARLQAALDAERLRQARLYYVTADMTALAVAAGSTPPREPFRADRAPSPYGLIVFAAPIGHYDTGAEEMPIVAMSWGPWDASVTCRGDGQPYRWLSQSVEGQRTGRWATLQLPADMRGTWITFYSHSQLPDIVGMRNGFVPPAVCDDNETILVEGAMFPRPHREDGVLGWAGILYTAWQMMNQEKEAGGGRLAASEIVPRRKGQAKLDRAAGFVPGDIRIVDVHRALRPSRAAAAEDERTSSGRRAVNWTCRWPVAPYRRSQCLNPYGHADGNCQHEDRIVPPHIKGPADQPLRVPHTVKVWSDQP